MEKIEFTTDAIVGDKSSVEGNISFRKTVENIVFESDSAEEMGKLLAELEKSGLLSKLKSEHDTQKIRDQVTVIGRECNISGNISIVQEERGIVIRLSSKNIRENIDIAVVKKILIGLVKQFYCSPDFISIKSIFSSKILKLNDIYVNLAIERDNTQQKKEKEALERKAQDKSNSSVNEDQDHRIKSYEDIFTVNKPIDLSEIFELYKEKQNNHQRSQQRDIRKILILGRAGIGKSTLCQNACFRWANDQLWAENFDLVIFIRLRELLHCTTEDLSLGEVILKQCIPEECQGRDDISAEIIETVIESLSNRVLFILDGFDEVSTEYDKFIQNEGDTLRKTSLSKLLHKLIGGNKHTYILTSRHHYIEAIDKKFIGDDCLRLETIGFTNENIKKYVELHFRNDISEKIESLPVLESMANQLLNMMKRNPSLWGIAHVPINLELICCLWQYEYNKHEMIGKDKNNAIDSITITKLYEDGLLWLLRRHYNRVTSIKEGWVNIKMEDFEKSSIYRNKLLFLEALAWESEIDKHGNGILVTGESELFNRLLDQYCPIEIENSLGQNLQGIFITELESLGVWMSMGDVRDYRNKKYYFMHLTFQEFFAAKFWVRLYCSKEKIEREKAEQIFIDNKYDRRFKNVWWFVAGLLGRKSQNRLSSYFKLIHSQPRELIGIEHITLLMRCLEESGVCLEDMTLLRVVLDEIKHWMTYAICSIQNSEYLSVGVHYNKYLYYLQRCPKLYSHSIIITQLCNNLDVSMKRKSGLKIPTLRFIGALKTSNFQLIEAVLKVITNMQIYTKIRVLAIKVIRQFQLSYLTSKNQLECIQVLLGCLKEPDVTVCMASVETIGLLPITEFTEKCQDLCIDGLISVLKNSYRGIRVTAAISLGRLKIDDFSKDYQVTYMQKLKIAWGNTHWEIQQELSNGILKQGKSIFLPFHHSMNTDELPDVTIIDQDYSRTVTEVPKRPSSSSSENKIMSFIRNIDSIESINYIAEEFDKSSSSTLKIWTEELLQIIPEYWLIKALEQNVHISGKLYPLFIWYSVVNEHVIYLDQYAKNTYYVKISGEQIVFYNTELTQALIKSLEQVRRECGFPEKFLIEEKSDIEIENPSNSRNRMSWSLEENKEKHIIYFKVEVYTLIITRLPRINCMIISIEADAVVGYEQRKDFFHSIIKFINGRFSGINIEYKQEGITRLCFREERGMINWTNENIERLFKEDFANYLRDNQDSRCVLC